MCPLADSQGACASTCKGWGDHTVRWVLASWFGAVQTWMVEHASPEMIHSVRRTHL